jgi:hypothetical protein
MTVEIKPFHVLTWMTSAMGSHANSRKLHLHLKLLWYSAPARVRFSKPNVSRLAPDYLLS